MDIVKKRVNIENNSVDGADILHVMANRVRLKMIRIMLDREIAVGELAKHVGLSQAATSQHLAKLREAELVVWRRMRQSIYYRSQSDVARRILRCLSEDDAGSVA